MLFNSPTTQDAWHPREEPHQPARRHSRADSSGQRKRGWRVEDAWRRFAPIYLIVAAILLFAARPGLAAISTAGVSGIVCGALQLLAAYFGAKRLYKTIYLIMVFELVGFIYFRIGPFDATIFQNSALMLLAVALQRTVCAYLHRFVFGGVSASAEE